MPEARDLTSVGLVQKMNERFLRQNGVAMIWLPTKSSVSAVLIAAIAIAGFGPAVGTCEATDGACGTKSCHTACCISPDKPVRACCSAPATTRVCRCSVENQRPATPSEKRAPEKRDDSIRGVYGAMAFDVRVAEPQARSTVDASLSSSLTTPHQQAVLCRWLT
jgi:hypothetical protein